MKKYQMRQSIFLLIESGSPLSKLISMIDNINLTTLTIPLELGFRNSIEPFYWKGILFTPKFCEGDLIAVEKFIGKYKGLRLVNQYNRLKVSNSLHKFTKGENYSDFRYSEIVKGIEILTEKFGIEAKHFTPTKAEIGINISLSFSVIDYLNFFNNYKGKGFVPMMNGTFIYGVKCILNDFEIKIYDKTEEVKRHYKIDLGENILRVEIGFKNARAISFNSLEELKKKETLQVLVNELLHIFSLIEVNQLNDYSSISYRDLELAYAGKDKKFWLEARKLNREWAKKRKQHYKKLMNEIKIESVKDEILEALKLKSEYLINN